MKFYGRETEKAELEKLWTQTSRNSKLAVITGRRRLGKTLLDKEFAKSYINDVNTLGHSKIIQLLKADNLKDENFIETLKIGQGNSGLLLLSKPEN